MLLPILILLKHQAASGRIKAVGFSPCESTIHSLKWMQLSEWPESTHRRLVRGCEGVDAAAVSGKAETRNYSQETEAEAEAEAGVAIFEIQPQRRRK